MLSHEKQIIEYENTIAKLKEQNKKSALWSQDEIINLEKKLELLKMKVYSELSPWQRINICRHPSRPHSSNYIQSICENFTELCGDRLYRDDRAVIAGLCTIGGVKFMVIAQEKGHDTKTRLHHNFGMPYPEGYRKALRCMKLAAKFQLPIVSFLDTPGAFAGLAAEERGQGWAIAENLFEMARLKTPMIVIIIGEGCSGGALGIGIGDRIAMLQHSYYSVITPEGCASILWKDSQKKEIAADALKLHPEHLLPLEIIDAIIEEPLGGAHHEPQRMYQSVKEYILDEWDNLKSTPIDTLLELRYKKFRKMGKFIQDKKTSM